MKTIIDETVYSIPKIDTVVSLIFTEDGSVYIPYETYRALMKHKHVMLQIMEGIDDATKHMEEDE